MGSICSIYLVSETEFEKVPRTFQAIEDFLEKNSPFIEDSEIVYFKNRYDTDKAWNPTFELLNKILINCKDSFLETESKIDNLDYYFQNSKKVKILAVQLSKIDQNILNQCLKNNEIKDQIKSIDGYKMESMDFHNLIIKEFEIIKCAYQDASLNERGVVLSFG
jgi:hypothetical protein